MLVNSYIPGNIRGQRAELLSPRQDKSSQPGCVRFFYYMFNLDDYKRRMGNLSVLLYVNDLDIRPLSQLVGRQPDGWQISTVTIPPMNHSFNVMFQVRLGDQYNSDIGLDDVKITSGKSCEEMENAKPINITIKSWEYQCNDGTVINNTHICDGIIDCPNGKDELEQKCFSSKLIYKIYTVLYILYIH